jgi:tetratricopeptide (TPR) repeat protein
LAIGAPLNGIALEIAARAFKHLGEYDKALDYYRQAVEHKVDSPGIHAIALEIAGLRHDQKEVERQIEWSRGTSAEGQILQGAGMAALADGHARESDRLFAQATAAARRDHVEADMAVIDAYRTRILAEMGLTARAKDLMESFTGDDTYMDRLYTMAELGDAGRAKAIALEKRKAAPQDTLLNLEYVPSVLAALELRAGKASDAAEQLNAAEAYELRDPTIAYLRGQAYLAAGRAAEAEAQFRILIANPGIDDPLTPLHALAHLNLARALRAENNPAEAQAELGLFLEMWKTADPDLPALKEAAAEMPKLANSK